MVSVTYFCIWCVFVFTTLKNVSAILSLRAIEKEAADQIWHVGHSLPTPALKASTSCIIYSNIETEFSNEKGSKNFLLC